MCETIPPYVSVLKVKAKQLAIQPTTDSCFPLEGVTGLFLRFQLNSRLHAFKRCWAVHSSDHLSLCKNKHGRYFTI